MKRNFDFYRLIHPLLAALNWQGSDANVFEAAPHLKPKLSLSDLRGMMVNLGYMSKIYRQRTRFIKAADLPCIFIVDTAVYLITAYIEGKLHAQDMMDNKPVMLLPTIWQKGQVCYFYKQPEVKASLEHRAWFRLLLSRFRPFLPQLCMQGMLNNLLMLFIPFLIWGVYDFVIPSNAERTLYAIMIGGGIGIVCSYVLARIHARLVSYVGARISMIISSEVFRKILSLPVSKIEGVSTASQVVWLRQLDYIREAFSSPLVPLILEAPFLLLFIVVVGMMGGLLVLIPLLGIFAYIAIGLYVFPRVRMAANVLSRRTQEREAFLNEMIAQLGLLKNLTIESIWLQRFKSLMSKFNLAQRDSERLDNFVNNIGEFIIGVAITILIFWGTIRVMEGRISAGVLIAMIMLVWRLLASFQAFFKLMGHFNQILSSIIQINRFMNLSGDLIDIQASVCQFNGAISFQDVSFYYPASNKAIFHKLQLSVNPGEVVAVVGENGSGKSTLFKLLLGLYTPQEGLIMVDGIDVRQYNQRQLRQAISYLPQQCHFFQGNIAQNLRLIKADATETEMQMACERAGLKLPKGLLTPVMEHLSTNFQRKLMLARVYLKDSKIFIFDEPEMAYEELQAVIQQLRGQKTILLMTHRPNYASLADRAFALHKGEIHENEVLQALAEAS